MIAYLRGKINYKSSFLKKDNFFVVDVSGVGYKVYAVDKLINGSLLGAEVELFIYTQVAETALDLYGFATQDELEFFELLISLSGIGPRSALDILRKAKIEDLTVAVQSQNYQVLSKVSGIGPKTAEKIVVGLKDKLGGMDSSGAAGDYGDALEALIGLGYAPVQARDALNLCQSEDMGEKVKEALKILGKK